MKNNKGFTLIELLVVIAIIGILSSVVLASLNTARAKSRDARRVADVKQIQLALELWADDNNGEYPDTIAQLVTDGQMGSTPIDPDGGAYIYDNLDNSAGGACAVADAGSCSYYQLGAELEDADHTALDADSDKDLSAAGGIDGNDVNCDTTAGAAADQCYDVVP